MKRMLAGGFVVLVACGSDPPPQAVMVPAASSEVPAPSSAPSPSPPPVASAVPTAAPEPEVGAVPAPAPTGSGTGQGFDNGHGRLSTSAPAVKAPSLRQGVVQVNGRLPTEVIQRIVRQNFGRFRLCYENGLKTDPKLEGKVVVKFTIDKGGAVVGQADGGSTISDAAMVSCVVRGFGNLSFPQPESGTVSVVYPILFAPGT